MNPVLTRVRRARLTAVFSVPLALSLAVIASPASAAPAPNAGAVQAADCSDARTLAKSRTNKAKSAKSFKRLPTQGCAGPRGTQGPKGAKGDRGPAGPAGPAGPCVDVAVVAGLAPGSEYSAALTRGRAFVGYRPSLTGAAIWRDLTRPLTPGFPRNACSVAVKLSGERVYVKVLTTTGDLYETSCTAPALACTVGWVAVVRP
ncbi:hypothetical protein AB0P15_34050 [Streptomyces sp. NPDC087917]|uniref:hypothetical protein n=1 Tax=Streptomyces sp. NPDC087917 TaxID=3155060 RepID=UPI003424708E